LSIICSNKSNKCKEEGDNSDVLHCDIEFAERLTDYKMDALVKNKVANAHKNQFFENVYMIHNTDRRKSSHHIKHEGQRQKQGTAVFYSRCDGAKSFDMCC